MTTAKLLPLAAAILATTIAAPLAAQDRGPAGTVTLARTDYDLLLDLAARPPRPSDGAPLPAALTRTDLRVRINAGTVRATMAVDGEVFQPGAVKVPLISQAILLDARAADRPLPLVAEGNSHFAIINGPATFSATLEWGTAVTTSPGRGSFMLPVPPAGSATAIFDVPGEQSDLRVSPGLVVRRTSTGGRSIVEATLDPGSLTTVSWSARETGPAALPRDTRLLADIKTLLTIGQADLRLLSLVDVTVVQGEPSSITVHLPAGYELVGATGNSLERTEAKGDSVALFLIQPGVAQPGGAQPGRRRHQFLLNLERSTMSTATATGARASRLETGFPTVPASQRESGEVAIEGVGTLEISSPDVAGLRRMDVREVHASLSSLATQSLLSAFRYQRTASAAPLLTLNVTRFADAAVLAAIADRAVATTLVTREGRMLTEVVLHLRNRAQPFMKVVLPAGASMLTVDVAGSPAKPADGSDGVRVPLLRPGFRPDGTYTVSFVYLNAGTAFARKGDMRMTLPRMDIPVNVIEWELFLPGEYRADRFGGSAIAADLIESFAVAGSFAETAGVSGSAPPLEGAGAARQGNKKANETVNRPNDDASRRGGRDQDAVQQMAQEGAPSANVQLLQRRAAGVLPVRIDVPRAGTSHRFVKPLVVDEETVVTFRYKQR